ncbi:MAG: DUF1566 domain-containing protein, partial [bacterium]|nr:DUF1566 domain-containing protein [bacterium]
MALSLLMAVSPAKTQTSDLPYTIVDTGQNRCYGNGSEINFSGESERFYGQDAQLETNSPSYRNNGDGTVTDLNTGLMWQKTPDFVKRNAGDAGLYANSLVLGGFDDWRVPTIKELFSIAHFNGNIHTKTPYIDTRYFDFQYPDTSQGWRIIDAQYRSSTRYVGTTMGRDQNSVFGFNFADGRIKGYPAAGPSAGRQYIRCVRGDAYGQNDFSDNGNGTVTDRATGLMWMKIDSAKTFNWEQALKYANGLSYAGYDDWRLPDVKELQSIVDYTHAPDARVASARGPAIDPVFQLTDTESWFWSGTTHLDNRGGYYVTFGQAFSAWKRGNKKMNAHGAGAVRSDPKTGNPADYPNGKGPQGDEIRIYNYVRCVRGGNVTTKSSGPALDLSAAQSSQHMREMHGNRSYQNSSGTKGQKGYRNTGGSKQMQGGTYSQRGNNQKGNNQSGQYANNRNTSSKRDAGRFILRLDKDK